MLYIFFFLLSPVFLDVCGGETSARCFWTGSGWSGFSSLSSFCWFRAQLTMLSLPLGSSSPLKVRDQCSHHSCVSFSLPDVPGSWSCLFVCLFGYKEPPGRFFFLIMIVSELFIFSFYTSESGFVMTVWEHGGRRHASESKQILIAQFNILARAFSPPAASTCTLCWNN